MRVAFSRFVEDDLNEIAQYIGQDNPERAVTFVQDIRAKFREIGQSPLIYQQRSELGAGIRLATVGNYAILFRALDNLVRIERVVYGGRNLSGILNPTG